MNIIYKFLNIFNFFDYIQTVYLEIKQYIILKKFLKDENIRKEFLNYKHELRVDNINRIYTVLNIPEEILNSDVNVTELSKLINTWIIGQISEVNEFLMSYLINDLVYPTVTQIKDVNTNEYISAYLLVLQTSKESLKINNIIKFLFKISLNMFVLFFILKIIF